MKVCEINELKIPYSSKARVEGLWVEVTKNFGEKLIVSVIYHHRRGNVKLFTEHFEKSLSKIENNRSIQHSITTGDFNIDLNDNTNEYLNVVLKNGFMPTILLPARVTNRACTLIDHIFYLSRNNRTQIASGNLMTDMSDHFANSIILHSDIKSKETDRPMVSIYSEQNKNTFQKLLGDVNWDTELEHKNVNDAMITFNLRITVAYNKSFPFKRLFRKMAKDKPWITTGLKESTKQKHLLYQKFIFDHSEENKVAYKIFKNKLRSVITKVEKEYCDNVFNSKTRIMKEMWKELGNLLNTKKKNKGSSISKIIINSKEITDDKDIANALNDHFTKIGKNLADKVRPENNRPFKNNLINPINESLFLRPTDNNEVLKEINQLKNKATIDIRVSLLKHVKQKIIKGWVIIFNKSFKEGHFPEPLKLAKVIPIYKSEDPTNPSNYRPISPLSVLDKLLEKLMYNRLDPFFQKQKVFYKYQFGFRKNHATNNALTEVMNYIYKSLDEGNYVFCIYIST